MLYEVKSGGLYLWYLGSHALIEKVHCYRFDPEQIFYAFEDSENNFKQVDGRQVREQVANYEVDLVLDGAKVALNEVIPMYAISLEQLGNLVQDVS
jgi:hypothetical protein